MTRQHSGEQSGHRGRFGVPGLRMLAVAVVAAGAALLGPAALAGATPSPVGSPSSNAPQASGPQLTVTPATALAAGQSVTVDGAGFTASSSLVVTECATPTSGATTGPSLCDDGTGTGPAPVPVTAGTDGTWSTPFAATPVVTSAGQTLTCTDAGVTCTLEALPAPGTSAALSSAPIAFATASPATTSSAGTTSTTTTTSDPSTNAAPTGGVVANAIPAASGCAGTPDVTPSTAATAASACQNLAAAGQTVTVSGTGFKPDISLYVAECNSVVPAGGLCNEGFNGTPKFSEVTVGTGGSWSTQLQLVPTVALGTQTANCATAAVKCAIQTSWVQSPTTRTQETTLPISFAAAAPSTTTTTTTTAGGGSTGSTSTSTSTSTTSGGSGSSSTSGGTTSGGTGSSSGGSGSSGASGGASTTTGAQLPYTGSSMTIPMALAGALMALAGGALLLLTGRRRWHFMQSLQRLAGRTR